MIRTRIEIPLDDLRLALSRDGYYVVDSLLDLSTCNSIARRLEAMSEENPDSKTLVPDPYFDDFIVHPRIIKIATAILGEHLLFHHMNGRVLKQTPIEKAWHHDYDAMYPWRRTDPIMIHIMIYPRGLASDNGPLLVLPGSHRREVDRSFPKSLGTGRLDGAVSIIVAPGTAVILNSALWHARELPSTLPRYDLNISYCQPGMLRPERAEWNEILTHLSQKASAGIQNLFRVDVTESTT